MAQFQDRGEVRSSAESILARPEFRHLRRSNDWKPPTPQDLTMQQSGDGGDTVSGDGDGNTTDGQGTSRSPQGQPSTPSNSGSGGSTPSFGSSGAALGPISNIIGFAFHGIAWLVIGTVCVLIVFVIIKAIANSERNVKSENISGEAIDETEETDVAPGLVPADHYVNQARALAAKGNFSEAVAQLLLGTMSYIERGGMIRYRRGLTIRDYLRAIRNQPQWEGLRLIVQIYEPIGFGRRMATRQHFEQAMSGYETSFGQPPIPAEI